MQRSAARVRSNAPGSTRPGGDGRFAPGRRGIWRKPIFDTTKEDPMAKKRDEDLYERLRELGVRKGRARKVSESVVKSKRNAPKAARRAISDLTGAAAEVQDRISKGPQKRGAAARKAAKVRARHAREQSRSGKKAMRTQARAKKHG
jgi:hypothetical protein